MNLPLQGLISHIWTKEDNHLKYKIEELSLNSSKANLVKSVVKVRFKGKQKNLLEKELMKKKK